MRAKPQFVSSPENCFDVLLIALPALSSIRGRDTLSPLQNLGIAEIAAQLAVKGFKVGLCDGDEQGLDPATFHRLVIRTRTKLLGITTYQVTIREALKLARTYKQLYPGSIVCLGGYQVSADASRVLEGEPYVDHVTIGPGAPAIERIFKSRAVGQLRRDIVHTRFPGEALPIFETIPRYWPTVTKRGSASLMASYGCARNCSFCSAPGVTKRLGQGGWRPLQERDVVGEVMHLFSRGIRFIHFHDADFLGPNADAWARALRIADCMREAGFTGGIRFAAHAAAVANTPPGYWRRWRLAGLERVFVGVESGSNGILRDFNKGTSRKTNAIAVRRLREAGITPHCGFIFFTPRSTVQDIEENLAFLAQARIGHYAAHYTSVLCAYPGAAVFDALDRHGLLRYKERYLDVEVSFDDDFVGRIAHTLAPLGQQWLCVDRLFRDLDSALEGRRAQASTEFGIIRVTTSFRKHYYRIRRQRASDWQKNFKECLSGAVSLADTHRSLADREAARWERLSAICGKAAEDTEGIDDGKLLNARTNVPGRDRSRHNSARRWTRYSP